MTAIIEQIPIASLAPAPENARAGRAPEHVDILAANIASYGVLSPLIGYWSEDRARFLVVDGRRRLAALTHLVGDGDRALLSNAPCIVRDRADAAAASLSANTQRVDLHPADAAKAFAAMLEAGAATDAVAKAFGVTERFVQSRVKLASLHAPIFAALAADEITLDIAQLYAGAELERQQTTWDTTSGAKGRAEEIKKRLHAKTIGAREGLALYVGEADYLAAGGRVSIDLFSPAEEGRWLDPKIADQVAAQKLEAERERLAAEGWSFVHVAVKQPGHFEYADGNLGKMRKATPEETARLKAIEAERKKLRKQINDVWDAADGDVDDDAAERLAQDAEEAIEKKIDALDDEEQRIEDGREVFEEAAKKKAGAVAWIDRGGALKIARGQIVPKATIERKNQTAEAKKSGGAAAAKPNREPPFIDAATHQQLSNAAGEIIGRALARQPHLAVAVAAAKLAQDILSPSYQTTDVLEIGSSRPGNRSSRLELLSDKEHDAELARWRLALKGKWDFAKLVAEVASWTPEQQLALFAFCVGESVNAYEYRPETDPRDRAEVIALARIVKPAPFAELIPSAELLEGYSLAALQGFAGALGIIDPPEKKEPLAAAVSIAAADKDWVPPIVAELCGVEAKLVAKKAEKPKNAKPKSGANDNAASAVAPEKMAKVKAAVAAADAKAAAKAKTKAAKTKAAKTPATKKVAKPKAKKPAEMERA